MIYSSTALQSVSTKANSLSFHLQVSGLQMSCNDLTIWQGTRSITSAMGLLLDTQNCGLRMRRECRERFPRHWLQRKALVSDPGMHHGTCVTHVPWCISGSLTRGGGENVPGIPGACATRNFAYLVRGPCSPDDTPHFIVRSSHFRRVFCTEVLQFPPICWSRLNYSEASVIIPVSLPFLFRTNLRWEFHTRRKLRKPCAFGVKVTL